VFGVPTESFLASFAERVRGAAGAPALRCNGELISYGELDGLAVSAAAELAGLSAGGYPVCVLGKKSPRLVATLLACFRAGHRVLLPPNDLGAATLAQLCEQAECEAVVAVDVATGPVVRVNRGAELDKRRTGHGPGLMLTTSGSTGLPKIVPLRPAAVDAFVDWAAGQFGIGPGSVVLNYAPLNFDLCLLDVWTSLARGACVELVDQDLATQGGHLARLVARSHVVQAVPMLFRLVTDAVTDTVADSVLDSVRHAVFTGDVMPAELIRAVRSLLPGARLYNLYGCTETNDSFLHRVDDEDVRRGGPLPIGVPIAGVTAAIVGPAGEVLSGAVSGELVVRTPFQCDGYLDPALDQGRFVPAPAGLPDGTYYRTGDLVSRDEDGRVTLLGRADYHVKVRGVRINLQEVEAVIAEHDEIDEVAVVTIPDAVAGVRLHAVARRREGSTINGLQLRQHCAARLVRTAIPGRLEIVEEPLPRTSTGKIDRNAVRNARLDLAS